MASARAISPTKRILMLICILILLAETCPVSPKAYAQGVSIPVGVFYYAWYNGTTPPSITCPDRGHWNSSSIPTWAVEDTPTVGFYNSSDRNVVYQQLSEMNSSGISFIVVSWWGIHPYDYAQQADVDDAVKTLYSVANSSFPNIKIVIMVEGFNESGIYDFNYIRSYVYATFYSAYPNEMFFLNNSTRPLLCWWNAPVMTDDYNRELIHNDTISEDRILGQDVYPRVDWYAWTPCSVNSSWTPYLNNADGVVTIEPRYDGSHINQGTNSTFDPSYSQGLYDSQWDYVLQNLDKIKCVLIYSWNEYHERSQIEPCNDSTSSQVPNYTLYKTTSHMEFLQPLASHWVPGWGFRDELNASDIDYQNFWTDNAGKILSMAMITGDETDASNALSFLQWRGLGSAASSLPYYLPEVIVNSSILELQNNTLITNRIVQLVENNNSSLQSLAVGNYYAGNTTLGYLGSDRILVSGTIYRSNSSTVLPIPDGFSKESLFEINNTDFCLYLNATVALGKPYADVSIQVLPLNSSLSPSDLLCLQIFSSSGQFDNASLYGTDGSFQRQLAFNNGSPSAQNGLIIAFSQKSSVLDEDSVAVSFNNSIATVNDFEHWYQNPAFDGLSWIGVAYNAPANSVGVLSQPIYFHVYPLEHLDYRLVNDTATYIASNQVNVAVSPPVSFGFISYGLALDATANPQNATLTSLARGYWNYYYSRYNGSDYGTPYARSINVFALAGLTLYGNNSTVEDFTCQFINNTSGDSIEEYAWAIAALHQLCELTNSSEDYSLYESFLGSLSAGGPDFMALVQSSTKNQPNPEWTFEFGETASGLMLGGVPFNYPIVISAMNAVYQSDVNGTICNRPYGGDEANTETLPAYILSTWLFKGEMKKETGYWITGLEETNVTSIAYSNETLMIQAVGNTDSNLTIANETGSYIYRVRGFETISIIIPEFSAFLILPLFMIATLLAAIAYRKRQERRG